MNIDNRQTITAIADDDYSTWSSGDAILIFVDGAQMNHLCDGQEPKDLAQPWTGFSAEDMFEFLKQTNQLDKFIEQYGVVYHGGQDD